MSEFGVFAAAGRLTRTPQKINFIYAGKQCIIAAYYFLYVTCVWGAVDGPGPPTAPHTHILALTLALAAGV